MNDDTDIAEEPHEEIALLESRIEELADGLERCRKIAVFSRILLAGGALWLALELFGIVRFNAPEAIASITAVLGGFILGGSNRSTMLQTQAALDAAEARRRDLIGTLSLQMVPDAQTKPQDTTRWLH